MFAIYDKDELESLTSDQEKALKAAIGIEIAARQQTKAKGKAEK